MKLFQIEEPDGGPADADAPGAAIGIDASGSQAEVAFSVGGNALVLSDREGYVRALPVPAIAAPTGEWQLLLEGARIRAERVLARPITHVVIVLAATPDGGSTRHLLEAADRAGLAVLRLTIRDELSAGSAPALAAAVLAEDLAPRPELEAAPDPG
ncbi:MAG TPA: hypothetical protein VJX94_05765 [Stellaceae bacterium]|nr:hypothetical protein [Stellaceae bacterium]